MQAIARDNTSQTIAFSTPVTSIERTAYPRFKRYYTPQDLQFGYQYPQTRSSHKRAIRSYLQVSPFPREINRSIAEIIESLAWVMDNPADLINAAIEELVKNRYELPSFATLDRLVSHIRTRVNQTLFTRVTSPLSHEFKQQLNEMFETQNHRQRSFYNDLKKLPQKSSRNHLNDLFVHLTWLETLGAQYRTKLAKRDGERV